jgi:hypothetical protein
MALRSTTPTFEPAKHLANPRDEGASRSDDRSEDYNRPASESSGCVAKHKSTTEVNIKPLATTSQTLVKTLNGIGGVTTVDYV